MTKPESQSRLCDAHVTRFSSSRNPRWVSYPNCLNSIPDQCNSDKRTGWRQPIVGSDPMNVSKSSSKPYWQGVFPAITTQMHRGGALDLEGAARHTEVLLASGVSGIIYLGSLGENQMLTAEEKRLVIREMVAVVRGRAPVLSGWRRRRPPRPRPMCAIARRSAPMASCSCHRWSIERLMPRKRWLTFEQWRSPLACRS